MKHYIYSIIVCLLICISASADTYTVSTKNGLNVRESATLTSPIVGKLNYKEQVNVISIEENWAKITWNGHDAYVHANYLSQTSVSKRESKGWNLWDWLFNSESDSDLLTVFKWFLAFFILLIAIAIGYFCLMLILTAFGTGLLFGGITLVICFILKWMGAISEDTMWGASKWGFYIGCGFGLLFAIFHPKEVINTLESNDTTRKSPTGLSPQINRFEGVRTHRCCGSCAYCTEGHECSNTNCKLYLERINPDIDGASCDNYSCRY